MSEYRRRVDRLRLVGWNQVSRLRKVPFYLPGAAKPRFLLQFIDLPGFWPLLLSIKCKRGRLRGIRASVSFRRRERRADLRDVEHACVGAACMIGRTARIVLVFALSTELVTWDETGTIRAGLSATIASRSADGSPL